MNRTRRVSFNKTREKIQNILASSQSSQNTNNAKVHTTSQDPSTSNQKNVKKPGPSRKKHDRRKKVAAPEQKGETVTAEINTLISKPAVRRGRKKREEAVNDENPQKATGLLRKRYVPNVNAIRNTRSNSKSAATAALDAGSNETNETVEEHLKNEQEKEEEEEEEHQHSGCIVVINRLTPQEIENWSKVRESENDENLTSHATESQRQLSVARSESINDELETQKISEEAKNVPEPIENNDMDTHETRRRQKPAGSETNDENLDYIQMSMTSEEEEEDDEMRGFVSINGSRHDSVQNADSGYQCGKTSATSSVREWLKKSLSLDSVSDAVDVPGDLVIPEHDVILNASILNRQPLNITAMVTEPMDNMEIDSAFTSQSQVSTHFSGTPPINIDTCSVASTHFTVEPEHEPISQMAAIADAFSSSTPVHESNLKNSISNATTHFSEDGQESPIQLDTNLICSGKSLNRPISVENVSNISSPKRSRDENELETYRTISVEHVSNISSPKRLRDEDGLQAMDKQIADEQNVSQPTRSPEPEIQYSRLLAQPERKRRKNGSVIRGPIGNSELNRLIVSQPTRHPPEFCPNDFQHTSQPFALAIINARLRPTSQIDDDNDSLLIDTPSQTEYQESNHQRFITQPTQSTRMNWGFSRNSSLETILATNTSNVSAIPKYRYNRHQEDQTCFPMASNTFYTSLVTNGGTTFAVNSFDHGNANITHHFLSRFNDELKGLNENFNGIVYTTKITAKLISHYLNVDSSRIKALEYNRSITVENMKVTALELTSWPGAALLAFDTVSNGIILHAGDLRIPADTEGIEYLVMHRIRKFHFDRSCLMKVYYQIPSDIDRDVGLIDECTKYHQQNNTVGMVGMIAFGAFRHGMESLILRLAEMLHMKVFMDLERRAFLDRMLDDGIQDADSIHYRLRKRVVDNPRKANIHILDVENINENYLSSYLSNGMNASFHRILAIRPRGTGSNHVQLALNRYIRIIDIPNPLVGDYYEYRRFVECVREDAQQEARQRQLQ